MEITFLGTGSSSGTPVPGCGCAVCGSRSPRDKRFRPALLIRHGMRRILIDTPPELRLQLIREKVGRIDAILFTHCHADHVYGLDDVRIFSRERKIPVYGNPATLREMRAIFPYVFRKTQKAGGKPRLLLKPVTASFRLFGLPIVPLSVFHGGKRILGYRISDFAYIPDLSDCPAATRKLMAGLDVLAIDALRDTPHPTHVTLAESQAITAAIKPRRTLFTHISHQMGHKATCLRLPGRQSLAYDGLTLSLKPHAK